MASLFVEISSEEIPARMQNTAISALETGLVSALKEKGFAPTGTKSAISPRHMAVEIDGLADRLEDRVEEKRGPRTSAPEQAIDGFCQSAGLSRDALEVRTTDKGEFYFAVSNITGAVLGDSIIELVQGVIEKFAWPKSQRWAETSLSWVRPLRSISVAIDGVALSGELQLSASQTMPYASEVTGHPFYADQPVKITDFDSYLADMKTQSVIVCHQTRRAEIQRQLEVCAAAQGLVLVSDEGLLDEICGLVEWPQAICGQIDDSFMSLPSEVLITSMKVHQKFFALKTQQAETAAPFFITVANRRTEDNTTDLIKAGNERVLRARLSDAAFFWEQDKVVPLQDYLPLLANVTFYEGLGSLKDKTDRLSSLAKTIAPACKADPQIASRAALLAKADLVTGMVGEFPELQGIMGGYYAAHHAEDTAISDAISQQYRPQGPTDDIPQTPAGLAVALADKIDTLVGFFGVGAKPTGSRDPYALRRAALGILRMIDEAEIDIDLQAMFAESARLYGFDRPDDDLAAFMQDRLKVRLRDKQISYDIAESVLSDTDITLVQLRWQIWLATALQRYLHSETGAALLAGYRRISSILASEAKTPIAEQKLADINQDHFEHQAETDLFQAISQMARYQAGDEIVLASQLDALAALQPAIDKFFDDVIVNDDRAEIRNNRLALLAYADSRFAQIADFSQVESIR